MPDHLGRKSENNGKISQTIIAPEKPAQTKEPCNAVNDQYQAQKCAPHHAYLAGPLEAFLSILLSELLHATGSPIYSLLG